MAPQVSVGNCVNTGIVQQSATSINRPGLELRERSLISVSVLAALGRSHELRIHLRGARNNGWTLDELREVCLHVAPYAGYPAALDALRVLSDLAQEEAGEER